MNEQLICIPPQRKTRDADKPAEPGNNCVGGFVAATIGRCRETVGGYVARACHGKNLSPVGDQVF